MKELCGSHLIFSGMNSACPNCKGRRAVKNISWKEPVVICEICGKKNEHEKINAVYGNKSIHTLSI